MSGLEKNNCTNLKKLVGLIEAEQNRSRCCMAHYCIHSICDKYCGANEEVSKQCPYLNAIAEIAQLSVESVLR